MDGEVEMENEDPQITQRIFNYSASVGDLFARQGLTRRMCDFVPFADLKNLRLVCDSWNNVVRHHTRYHSSRVVFRINWIKNSNGFHLDSITKWTNITLQYFPLHRNTFFVTYWAHIAPFVKILNLEHLKVGCTHLGKIVNKCTSLEEIKFVRIYFDNEEISLDDDEVDRLMDDGDAPDMKTLKVYCNHNSFDGQVTRPTIKSIVIFNTDSFPNCLLDLLERKCHRVLETFSFDYNTTGNNINRIGVSPTSAQIHAHIIRICQGNRLTLKHFSWTRNDKNGDILTTMGEDQEMNLTLETLSVALRNHKNNPDFQETTNDLSFVPLIRSNISTLVEMNLSVSLNEELRQTLLELLPQLTNLTRMKFQIDHFRPQMARNVNIFQNCQNLRELVILDKTVGLLPSRWEQDHEHIHNNWHPHFILPGVGLHHLSGLPMSIRKLTCVHRMSHVPRITDAIQNPTMQMLTKLVIEDGTRISDHVMQLIITNLSLLEVLSVKHGRRLTDAGLTGLNPVDCARVIQCRSQGLLLKEPKEPIQGAPIRHSLRDLIYIRELDFTHCHKISDISLCYAIRFPELEKLVLNSCNKVTDIGLSWLGVHNPKLRELEVKGNQAISRPVLNRLVTISKSIRSIRTDEVTRKRMANMALYTEHPYFKDIVDCKSKSEQQSRSYEMFDTREKKNRKIQLDNFEI